MGKTQNQRILDMLQYRGDEGLCSIEPIRWSPPILRTASRITDLKQQGHTIAADFCTNGDHGDASGVKRYRLVTEPVQQKMEV